ncbi:hypothetical protein [Sinomonas sp. P47F7]|uniref:hypothetical protein n=1 Tax=Sinomonas sp. P47F7 TaxID=3410987 RepID=UPI003BF46EF0
MSEMRGLLAEKEAFNDLSVALYGMLAEGDDRIEYRASMTVPVHFTQTFAYNPFGRYEAPDGKANSPLETSDVRDALKMLRKASYRTDAGTWFSLRIIVTSDGAATAEYNYDKEPNFGLGGIDPVAYVADQEAFPRDEGHQPDWLKQRLAEGRAGLAARGE